MKQDVEELIQRNRALEAEIVRLRIYKEYAYTDVLTEIPNRRFYYERLSQEVARACRNGHQLSIALVDLDHFKTLNDSAGHRAGDQVLKFFAQFLRANLRQEDVVCRLGGDEFTLLRPLIARKSSWSGSARSLNESSCRLMAGAVANCRSVAVWPRTSRGCMPKT
jgi:diguanylate cyclase (GGDEF)-like protein